MITLAEIYEFNQQVAEYHDVGWFEIKMNYFILAKVANCLNYWKHQAEFRKKGDRFEVVHELGEIFERDVVHQNAFREHFRFIDWNVILRQENWLTVFDLLQYFYLVVVAHTAICLLFDHHKSMKHCAVGLGVRLLIGHKLMTLAWIHKPEL